MPQTQTVVPQTPSQTVKSPYSVNNAASMPPMQAPAKTSSAGFLGMSPQLQFWLALAGTLGFVALDLYLAHKAKWI